MINETVRKQNPFRIFITGTPGCGKTTLIKKIGDFLSVAQIPISGFFTEEIREGGKRVGFKVIDWEGNSEILAHVHIVSSIKIGKYNVFLENFEKIAIPSMKPTNPHSIVIIDEIGKMECASNIFKKLLMNIVNSERHLIATIAIKGNDFIETLKKRYSSSLFFLDRTNHNTIYHQIVAKLSSLTQQNLFP